MKNLPKPECAYGYTQSQLDEIFPTRAAEKEFEKFMRGQTVMLCDGREPCTQPHGAIVYDSDVRNFFSNRRFWD